MSVLLLFIAIWFTIGELANIFIEKESHPVMRIAIALMWALFYIKAFVVDRIRCIFVLYQKHKHNGKNIT
jgi:hypothetical protein